MKFEKLKLIIATILAITGVLLYVVFGNDAAWILVCFAVFLLF